MKAHKAGTLGEWLLGGISLLAVLAVAGLLAYRALAPASEDPAMITIRAESVREVADSIWQVDFIAANGGGAPATDVMVQGRVRSPDGQTQTATASIAILPEGSERRGTLQFTVEPGPGGPRLRAVGWVNP